MNIASHLELITETDPGKPAFIFFSPHNKRWDTVTFQQLSDSTHRFATRTLILPTLKHALATLTFESPWIAQTYIEETHICTYSIVHNGHITAHTAYRSDFTAGQGAMIAFQHIDHQAVFS
jgi:hypothetical protein